MTSWEVASERIDSRGTLRLTARCDGRPITWGDAIVAWQTDDAFCDALSDTIREPFDACFWETPPLTLPSLGEAFECVVIDSPALATVVADPTPFHQPLAEIEAGGIAVFDNLSGDARLVVPAPTSSRDGFGHLAAFLRAAPEGQIRSLWCTVGRELGRRIQARTAPVWVSTSGLGVFWVHVRLDDRPKYYVHPPYRRTFTPPLA